MDGPGNLAVLDQVHAALSVHVDALVETAQKLSEDRDPMQAGADIAAMLNRWPIADVAAVAAVAVLRLARDGAS